MTYFFKTMVDKGRNRLRPMSGQVFPDGTKVDSTLNVSSDKTIRSLYPIGTVFCSEELSVKSGFLEAGNIYPIGIKPSEYIAPNHKPSDRMVEDYNSFIGVSGCSDASGSPREESSYTVKDTYLSKLKKDPKLEVPSAKQGFYVDDKKWYLLARNILNQVNTMIVGPTGIGKTELVLLACKKLGINCRVYDMGSMYDPIAGLLGVHRLEEGGVSKFDYAKFTQDISEPGVILLDELSRAPVTTNNILFPCLDSRRELPVEIAGGKDVRKIHVHKDCCFIATANVGAEYTGTMSMDRALVNRFFPIELDYMPESEEISVLQQRCRVDQSAAKLLVSVAQSVRKLFVKQELSCSLSTRETLMAAELVSDGWSVLAAMELIYLPLFEGTRSDGERGIVNKMLMAR